MEELLANDIDIIVGADPNATQWVCCKHCNLIIVAKEFFDLEYWDAHMHSRRHKKKMRELRAAAAAAAQAAATEE